MNLGMCLKTVNTRLAACYITLQISLLLLKVWFNSLSCLSLFTAVFIVLCAEGAGLLKEFTKQVIKVIESRGGGGGEKQEVPGSRYQTEEVHASNPHNT